MLSYGRIEVRGIEVQVDLVVVEAVSKLGMHFIDGLLAPERVLQREREQNGACDNQRCNRRD